MLVAALMGSLLALVPSDDQGHNYGLPGLDDAEIAVTPDGRTVMAKRIAIRAIVARVRIPRNLPRYKA